MAHVRIIPFPSAARRARTGAFTLIELIVVMTIIILLVGTVVTIGRSVLDSAGARNTAAVLTLVRQAVEAFEAEQPPIIGARQNKLGGGSVYYRDRYSQYPPDELEPFTTNGLVGSTSGGSLYPGRHNFYPGPNDCVWGPMSFQPSDLNSGTEHRDLAALLLALRLSSTAQGFVEKIPERYRTEGVIDPATGDPGQFIDRDANALWSADEDLQIPYVVDHWGMPLVYYAQRDWDPDDLPPLSTNHADWNQAATEMVRLNGGRPIIMSYGANGRSQLEDTSTDPSVLLHVDWAANGKTTNSLQDDNIYADPSLADKLRRGDTQ
jgi:type II secretory pathway pseudopilin PulG